MRTLKLLIEYDGTGFCGWQYQPEQRTVQGELEKAVLKLTREESRVHGSGRTDSGVHALGQTAHIRTNSLHSCDIFYKGLNRFLARDVRIIGVEEAADTFDSRRDALRRRYRYVISRRPRAVGRQYAWCPREEFSLSAMKEAASSLIGDHDFTSFCKQGDAQGSCRTIVYDITWNEEHGLIFFEIEAIRYLHNMIRIVIGTLLEVGRGKMSCSSFQRLLEERNRCLAGQTAPAHGLFLLGVDYQQ